MQEAEMSLDLPISDNDIEVIAREHLTDWKSLRPTLGLTIAEEDDICHDYKESQKQKRAFLHKWREHEGKRATYRVFSDAATKVKNKKLSDAVIAMGRRASASERESQARRVSLRQKEEEKAAEIAQLHEQMSQLQRIAEEKERIAAEQMSQLAREKAEKERIAEEKERIASEKEREVAELRRQLQTLPPKQSSKPVPTPEEEKALYGAAQRGDVSTVRRLIGSNVNIDCKPYQKGSTPLMAASFEGHVDIVRILIEAKAQINTQQENGGTPLFIASQNGHSDVVNILIRNGANINMAKKTGTTPLFVASGQGHSDVVNILIRNGAGVNIAANDGATPLFMASKNGHSDVVNTLIRNGADVNLSGKDGGTPLFIASQNGHSDVVNTLIRNGADVNLSWKGVKSIDIARTEGHTAIVQLLERRH